jgi:POT family proton-dependent oligopeptide transporter
MLRQRHPVGLYVLFFTEMWERFGFYCMLAIFVLYMTESGHPLLQQNASQIYGLYLGFVYFTPFFGGLVADRAWGYGRTILAGAVVLGLGYFLLAVDHLGFFFAGLLALVLGNGLFKPNISVLVGKLYRPGDPRLDNAFTIFYMGINVGAFTSPLVAQYLRKEYGYHTAFAAAGVGMALSLVIFLVCQRWLRYAEQGPPPPEPEPARTAGTLAPDTRVEPAAPVGVRPGTVAVSAPEVAQVAADLDVPPAVQRRRHAALLIIFVIVALFWMGFKQNGNTFALWARDCTDRHPSEAVRSVLQTLHLDRLVLDKEGASGYPFQGYV